MVYDENVQSPEPLDCSRDQPLSCFGSFQVALYGDALVRTALAHYLLCLGFSFLVVENYVRASLNEHPHRRGANST